MVVDCDTPVMATTLVHTYVCMYVCMYVCICSSKYTFERPPLGNSESL